MDVDISCHAFYFGYWFIYTDIMKHGDLIKVGKFMSLFRGKPELKRKKRSKKQNIDLFIVLVVIVSMLVGGFVTWFNINYKLRSPIVIEFRLPWESKIISPIPDTSEVKVIQLESQLIPLEGETPTPSPKAVKRALHVKPQGLKIKEVQANEAGVDFNHLFETVRQLESQKGTAPQGHHIYCANKGLWNEIGYGNRLGLCFGSQEEGKTKLISWYEDKFARGMTLAQAMCYWESGLSKDTCTYYQNYLKY